MASTCYEDDEHDSVGLNYSVLLKAEDGKLVIKHGVAPQQLQFRFDGKVANSTCNQSVTSTVVATEPKAKPPAPPGFAPVQRDPESWTVVSSVRIPHASIDPASFVADR